MWILGDMWLFAQNLTCYLWRKMHFPYVTQATIGFANPTSNTVIKIYTSDIAKTPRNNWHEINWWQLQNRKISLNSRTRMKYNSIFFLNFQVARVVTWTGEVCKHQKLSFLQNAKNRRCQYIILTTVNTWHTLNIIME